MGSKFCIIFKKGDNKKTGCLTPRECALIQTFPPDYTFVSHKKNSTRFELSASGAYKVIGNAVPPVLAYHIANRIQTLWPLYFKKR